MDWGLHIKPFSAHKRSIAFTLVEMLVVIAIIGILASLLLPVLEKARAKAKRIQCVADLKQVGVGFHSFLHDHDSKLPMQVSTNDGGTLEFAVSSYLIPGEFYFQFRHFQALSNELRTPKLLLCPSDKARLEAPDFREFNDMNVSYFVGVNADYGQPNSILAGDRNITSAPAGPGTIIRLDDHTAVSWTGELHGFKGNILYADGRVEELNGQGLMLASYGAPPASDLFVPSVQNPGPNPGPTPGGPRYNPPPQFHAPPPGQNPSPSPGTGTAQGAQSPSPSKGNNAPMPMPAQAPSAIAASQSSLGAALLAGEPVQPQSALRVTNAPKISHSAPVVKTNPPPEILEPVIVAQTPVKWTHKVEHWFLFLLLLALFMVALEIMRRHFSAADQPKPKGGVTGRNEQGK